MADSFGGTRSADRLRRPIRASALNLHSQPGTSNIFLENRVYFQGWRAEVSRPRPGPVPVGSGMTGSAAQRPSGPPGTRPASRARPPVRGCDRMSVRVRLAQPSPPPGPGAITSPLCCWCQVAGRVSPKSASAAEGMSAVVPGRMVVSGPGVAGPKSWRSGCELAALESESFPGCPPGPLVLAAAAWRASAWRRAKMASLILRLRDLSASLRFFPRPLSCRSRRGPRCACAGAG
jgi:hypothetical protein